jgi:hypothetical protein
MRHVEIFFAKSRRVCFFQKVGTAGEWFTEKRKQ